MILLDMLTLLVIYSKFVEINSCVSLYWLNELDTEANRVSYYPHHSPFLRQKKNMTLAVSPSTVLL